jgi:hypothetical protein
MINNVESPIVAIVGNKGTGKTLMLCYLGERAYYKQNRRVYANFHLTKIPYQKFDFEMLAELPEEMENGIILMDEAHMGADAYEFLSKKSKSITTLATQLRKRKLELYMTTQRFTFISKRLRDLTDFIYTTSLYMDHEGNAIRGVANVEIYDRNDPFYDIPLKKFVFDGRKWFGHYNTSEVVK